MTNSYLNKMFGLSGKTAFITGGYRGLGAGIAKGLASAGANVVIADICTGEQADPILREIEELGGKASFLKLDVTNKELVDSNIDECVRQFGSIDILVNNAGIATTARSEMLETEDLARVVDVNLNGTIYCCQAAGKHMMKNKYGRIINISSYWALTGHPGGVSYSVSKGGVISLTNVLAVEWGSHNITVNSLAPGYIHTEMTKWVWGNDAISSYITDRIPLGNRLGTPEEVAGVVNFLASEAGGYVTGLLVPIDGGLLIQGGKAEWFFD